MKALLKILIIATLLLNITFLFSQSVGIAAYQDPTLALTKDGHGNTPYTFDMTFKVKLQGRDTGIGYLSINAKYRYADLNRNNSTDDPTGYLMRYGLEAQYYIHFGLEKWHFAPTIGYGIMQRSNTMAMSSWEFGGEITFALTDNIKLLAEGIYMERPEWGGEFFPNGSLGIQYDIKIKPRK